MTKADLKTWMDFARKRTMNLIETIAKEPNPEKILGWRPGPGRAHIAWQLMHLGATDDRHLNIRMNQGEAKETQFVERFAGGSTPDDEIPSLDTIRQYLTSSREAILNHLMSLDDSKLDSKPHDTAQWVYSEWFQVLAWHEAHHQGQAHLTWNLYKQSGK